MNSRRGRISILWLLSATALVPLVTLGALLLWLANRSAARTSDALGEQVIAAGAGRVEDALTHYLDRAVRESDVLSALVRSGTIDGADISVWRDRMFAHLRANPEVASIGFAKADHEYTYLCRFPDRLEYALATRGDVARATPVIQTFDATFDDQVDPASRQTLPYDVEMRPWYTLAIASAGPAWTPVYRWFSAVRNRDVAERGVAYVRAIRRPSGELVGVLSIDLALSRVSAFLDQVAGPLHAFMFITDASGERIGASAPPGEGFAGAAAIEAALAAQRGRPSRAAAASRLVIDGETYWARAVELRASPTTRWYLTLVIPERPILGDARADARWIVLAGLACMLATAAVTAYAARLLSAPVRRLADFARDVGAGRFDRQLEDVGVSHEVAELSVALNVMAGNLRERVTLLAQRDAAREASALKARVVAHVSHEFRTPLNAILNYGELLQETAARAARPADARDAANILTAGRQLLRLVDDLLDLSRLDAGRFRPEAIEFSLGTLLDEVRVTVEPLVERNGNRLLVCAPPAGVRMRSDPARLRQVLVNLLGNAGKFTRDGEVRLDVTSADGDVVFRVSDTGPGIAADDLTRIFEPFTQGRQAGGGYRDGAGLGLAIASQLCHALGGTIDVESGPGRGTCFTVRLPLGLASTPRGPTEAADEPVGPCVANIEAVVNH